MATDDAEELQKLLESPTANRARVPHEAPTSKGEREKPFTEWSQWQILPNGRFTASGMTDATLPVGAYTVNMSPAVGLYFERKRMLTDTLIDLDESNSLRVIDGIKRFWTKREKYNTKGILFKRGVLLWGPPGSGKTATVALLVEDLISQGGIVLLVQHPELAVMALTQLRKIEPDRHLIVILEDVEEIIQSFGEHHLLALLDGEHQTENVVNIATTNYPEQLGARIINRPSRFDEVIKIGMPSARMREQYLWHVLGDDHAKHPVASWVRQTEGMSIAHLKELVVAVTCLDQSAEEVIERLKSMKTVPKSQMYDGAVGFGSRVAALAEAASMPGR